jgi:Polyketide cyclase / dehydrase and lipid transport
VEWSFEHTADSAAGKEAVWGRYADVAQWADWSPAIEWARLKGPFQVGAKGKSKARGAPAAGFRLVRVEPNAVFATETRLPGARLLFEHFIEPGASGVRITHRATLSGPLARLYERWIRSLTRQSLPDGVDRLAGTTGSPDAPVSYSTSSSRPPAKSDASRA